MPSVRWRGWPAGLAVLLTWPAGVLAHGESLTGVTLFQEGTELRLTYLHLDKRIFLDGNDRISDPLDRELRQDALFQNISYGISSDVTLNLTVPEIDRELRFKDPAAGSESWRVTGLGDILISAKHRFYFWSGVQRHRQMAVLAGLEAPTGETDAEENGVRLPTELQLGSGSWDGVLAASYTEGWQYFDWDVSVLARINSEGARDHKEGNQTQLSNVFAYYFFRESFPGPEGGAGLVTSWVHDFHDKQDGDVERDSGGDTIYVSPFLFWSPRPDWYVELVASWPAYQNLNGPQLGESFRAVLAIRYRF